MISRRTGTSLVLGLALLLTGCGFRPLYGESAPGISSAAEMKRIRLDTRNDRVDYLVRTNLLRALQIEQAAGEPLYKLRVRLRERREGVAVERDTSITRFNYRLTASFDLIDLETNETLFTGRDRSVAAYNVVDNQFATLSAQRQSEERAALDISDQIKLRLAIYFDQRSKVPVSSETGP